MFLFFCLFVFLGFCCLTVGPEIISAQFERRERCKCQGKEARAVCCFSLSPHVCTGQLPENSKQGKAGGAGDVCVYPELDLHFPEQNEQAASTPCSH